MEKLKLGDMLTFQRGYDLTHSQMKSGNIPVVGSSEIIGWHNKSNVKAPVLLIGRSGTVGRPQYYETDIWAHNTTLFVSDFHGNDPKFCFYFLKNLNLEDYANSSGVPTLNRNFIHPLIVNFPDLPTQTAITHVLSSLDDKIELNNKINKELESLARTLYNWYFIQNRKSWEVRNLNTFCEIVSGYAFKPEIYTENGKYKVITIKNVQEGFLDLSNVEKTDIIPEKMKDHCKLRIGDVLISLTGNVGRMCFVDDTTCLLNQRVGKLIVKDKKYFEWIYCLLQSAEQRTHLEQIAGGSSQANLSPIQAVDLELAIPDDVTLLTFSKQVQPIFSAIIKNRQESAGLAQLRDFLLPLLINGQVEVKDK